MDILGQQLIAAPRQRVWDALNDPVILKASLPGCESVERITPALSRFFEINRGHANCVLCDAI
jgi:carbon monoxide dehydrogenase subunit G